MKKIENIQVLSVCEHCGKPEHYIDKDGELVGVNHMKCRRIAKFKHLSITSKFFDDNKFENAIVETEKEKTFFQSFKKYVENFETAKREGIGFLLVGNPGTGKTFSANCITNELIKKGYAVLSFNLSGYLSEIKKGFVKNSPINDIENKLLGAVTEADLIVIDDVGSEKLSEWGEERMFNLFDKIYNHKKAIIVTSNLNGGELSRHLSVNGSSKISDRVTELCKTLIYDFKSKRAEIGKQKFDKLFGEAV